MQWRDDKGLWDDSCGAPCLIEPSETWIAQNQPQIDPLIVVEPVDEEKAAMAEAIIDLETRLTALESV